MKILEITSELDGGGVDRLLYDYCSRMIPDIQFDFVVTSKTEGMLEQPLKELGCNVFHIYQIRENRTLYKGQLQEILKNGNYDVVHDHGGYKAIFSMYYAKKFGVKGRIAHSHIAFIPEKTSRKLERKILTPITASLATNLYACGIDAAKWMWGEKKYDSGKVHIMVNAIDYPKFQFSEEKRADIRERLGLQGKLVVGNVARFSYQKNHEFIVSVFDELVELDDNSILLLIGRGELYDDVVKQVENLGLSDKVVFLGIRDDVHEILNAMDVFLLPSRYEGLPVTLVEVQANGLPVLVSTAVTNESKIADNYFQMSLEESPRAWAKTIIKLSNQKNTADDNVKSKSDINVLAIEQEYLYMNMAGRS
ncbi:MAG: glycosyltransferase family 1 protein [Desulfitobacterium hafniense]|nr:glycosyltransferase family 1 protein [Desulfitobacterium hafniense]